MSRALVFGGSGAIGTAIGAALEADGYSVLATSRSGGPGLLAVDPIERPETIADASAAGPFDAVVWAQGTNLNDTAVDVRGESFTTVMDANVTFVVVTLGELVRSGAVRDGARLVVLSSIWQEIARPGKFSYTVSKAALGGLVRAASVDLSDRGILINGVLPSVTDTPMTRSMLSDEQVAGVANQTGFGRLSSLEDVTGLVTFLASRRNTGVTGQSIAVDLGFIHARPL